jgi:hypothetical protein
MLAVSRCRSVAWCGAFSALLACFPLTSLGAADSSAGRIDPKAATVLKGMSDYLAKEQSLAFRAVTFFDAVQEGGIKFKTARELEIVLKRPKQVYARSLDDAGLDATIWFDGEKLTVWRGSDNKYMKLAFEGDTDRLLDELIEKYEFQLPLADLLYSDVNNALSEKLMSSEYVGLRTVDGVPCHQLSFESDGADWQLWVEADSTPVPRRFVIDFVTEDDAPQYMAQFDAWSLGAALDDDQFTSAIPEGAEQIEFGKVAADGQ